MRVSPAGGDDTAGILLCPVHSAQGWGPSVLGTMESTGGLEGAEGFQRFCSPRVATLCTHGSTRATERRPRSQ